MKILKNHNQISLKKNCGRDGNPLYPPRNYATEYM
jgi:hypothetical protein